MTYVEKRLLQALMKITIIGTLRVVFTIPTTNAVFVDQAVITANTVTMGFWEEEGGGGGGGSEGGATPGSVVINEIMWMGSSVSTADEWIELKNTTNEPIDIGQWTLENAGASGASIMIPAGNSIPGGGFFLIANYPETSANSALNVGVDQVNASLSLANSANGHLVLKNSIDAIIDQAKGDSWPAGENDTDSGIHRSMERNDTPGDGLIAANWHHCLDAACNDTVFWKSENGDYGTPKSTNLSTNDSSSHELETNLTPLYSPSNHTIGFKLEGNGLDQFQTLTYAITYTSSTGLQQILGSQEIGGNTVLEVKDLFLGTCSSGGTCVYQEGITYVHFVVTLIGPVERTLTADVSP